MMLISVVFQDSSTPALMIILLFLYLIPGICAILRGHPAAVSIFVLNLLLGWTMLVWVIALVWAVLPIDTSRRYR